MALCCSASALSPGFPRACRPASRRHEGQGRRSPPIAAATAARCAETTPRRRTESALEARASLVAALASQTFSLSQRVLREFVSEAAKYAVPARRFGEPRNLEEALMSGVCCVFTLVLGKSLFFRSHRTLMDMLLTAFASLIAVPDLESVNFKVLKRAAEYEIREVESYYIAETIMPGKRGFDFNSAGQAFNILAAYLFGENTASEQMEMTTPVFTRKIQSDGHRMEMTTPVITRKVKDEDNWQMSFVMPSKYGGKLPLPVDPSVKIKEVPRKFVAVTAFSGLVSDVVVKQKEQRLRDALNSELEFQVKENALVEVAQFNPPFTLPFTRRNEVSLEVEKRDK